MLEGKKIFLRGLKKEDTKWLYSCFSDFGLRKLLGAEVRTTVVSEHYEEEFIKKTATEKTKRVFVVCEKKTKKPVGLISLTKIDFYNGTAEVGYWICREQQSKGYATEALSLVLKFAKEWLRLRKVTAKVFAINKASIRVLEKNGFELVGRFKEHEFIPGYGFVDELLFERFL